MRHDLSGEARTLAEYLTRQDFGGGLIILAVAIFAWWQSADLAIGTLGGMGPGMLPRALAAFLGLLGLLLLVSSFLERGVRLYGWSLRGPIFILGAMVAFGLAVRPLGLVAAGPIAIIVGAFASDEVRWVETIIVGILTTVFCVVLFKLALGLPIPLAPWLLGY
jgi:putative tricarboxylic transport membrane protein